MKLINKPKRKPFGPIESMNFDKTNVLQEVQSYNMGSTINYSFLAKNIIFVIKLASLQKTLVKLLKDS